MIDHPGPGRQMRARAQKYSELLSDGMLGSAKAIDQWAFQYAQYVPTKIHPTCVSLSNSEMEMGVL